jgi:hypothetical protein
MSSSLRHRSYGPPRDEPRPCQAQSHCGQSRTLPSPCRHERHGADQGSGNSLLWVTSPEMTSESQVSESKSPKASQSTDLPAALSIICANRNLRGIHVTRAKTRSSSTWSCPGHPDSRALRYPEFCPCYEFIRLRHVGTLRLIPQNATKPNKSADLLQK